MPCEIIYTSAKIIIFAFVSIIEIMNIDQDINRIKLVLVEKKRTNKWLAQELGKDPATVSKWCTNTTQPDLQTLTKVAGLLDVDIKDLLWSTKS